MFCLQMCSLSGMQNLEIIEITLGFKVVSHTATGSQYGFSVVKTSIACSLWVANPSRCACNDSPFHAHGRLNPCCFYAPFNCSIFMMFCSASSNFILLCIECHLGSFFVGIMCFNALRIMHFTCWVASRLEGFFEFVHGLGVAAMIFEERIVIK